jgi:hypothetical protein
MSKIVNFAEIWHLPSQPNLVKLVSRAATEANFLENMMTDVVVKLFFRVLKKIGNKKMTLKNPCKYL